ncbi:alanine racemase [Parvicella tangerina]|uniref:Alanine racemase n=1 Tax=Parvicella tangerina TaxID=2829795 RepID=A0A916N9B2_9FLAO|nr:alanine racemase [Parvicella tangerina]CAG5078656.1 Alanine racemase [Parvicella tangerina]
MNLNYSLNDIAQAVNGKVIGDNGFKIKQVIIDSRNFFSELNTLFIAIKGKNNDGHDYISPLYEEGCSVFMIEEGNEHHIPKEANAVVVANTLKALQDLAAFHRSHFSYPVVAISGSNGKTIVKEWLYHLLKRKYNIIRSPKSYNSQVGVPLSILQMTPQHNLAIFEAGISQEGEMEKLEAMLKPTHGILTHIGSAHSVNFESEEHIKTEKLKLFKGCQWLHSFEENKNYLIETVSKKKKATVFVNINGDEFDYEIPFSDEASITNSVTAVVAALALDASIPSICKEIVHLPSVALRLETKKGINQNILINDSYSNDINSLSIALNHLVNRNEKDHKVVILSDIEQDFHESNDLYTKVAKMIKDKAIDQFIGIGPNLFKNQELFDSGVFFQTVDELFTYLKSHPIEQATILIKGARKFRFEAIGKYFELQSHESKLTIDLGALRNNVKAYQQLLSKDVKLLCMVKAFGYGSGSKEIGLTLEECNVDYLGVAYADEGKRLRMDKIDTPTIVMNAKKSSFDTIIDYELEPSIYSFRQLNDFIRALIDLDIKSYPIHIKIDTGMRRLGFMTEDVEELISTLSSQPEVRVKSIFSHLAASDDPKEDLFTNKQIQQFQYVCHKIESGVGYDCIKHILNTSGIERFPHAQMDMVRLGLGMYGVTKGLPAIENVGVLTTNISQVKNVKKGESIGYGRAQFALKDMTIGVIPIGYADGFSRNLSCGKGHVWVNGCLAKVVGNVCMDMTMIDLTDIPAKEGDEIEIFGKNRSIYELSEEMETIPYEVLTSISKRVQRVYLTD